MLEKLETPVKLVSNCELEPPSAYSVHPNYPPDNSIEHDVKEGENLISIANRSDYAAALAKYRPQVPEELLQEMSEEMANARALIYFNFGTVTPEYVNWYLLNITCCYHATENKTNRRFSNHDATSRSPKYGIVKRAGKIYIPKDAVKPKPKPVSNIKNVKMWARLHYEDGLFKFLGDLDKGIEAAGTARSMLDTLEKIVGGELGKQRTVEELRKIARIRKFVKPLRKVLGSLGRISPYLRVADAILSSRVVHGYLAMSYTEPFDTHYAWEVDMVLKGDGILNDDSGSFSTSSDPYTFRSDIFNPELWGERELACTMTGGSFSLAIKDAFKRPPHAGRPEERPFIKPALVYGSPGQRDWQLSLRPLHSIGGGVALWTTVDLDIFKSRIHNGARRSHTTIVSV